MKTLRKLGHVVDLQGKRLADLSAQQFYRDFLPNLWHHGVICVKTQEMNHHEYVGLANKLGQAVRLPSQLAFNNQEPEFPEIARVGNVAPNGEVMKKFTAAEYWHTDGQFWPAPKNFIVNWLYSRLVPNEGGETAFLDMRDVYEKLDEVAKPRFKNAKMKINIQDIKDFKGVDAEKIGFQEITRHPTVFPHPIISTPALYVGSESCILEYEDGTSERAEEFIKKSVKEHPPYIHKWDTGDLLIWDNTQVMHRGLGGYQDMPRLLFRAQSMIHKFDIDVISKFC